MTEKTIKKSNFLSSFVAGAKNGFNLSFTSMAPNVMFAFALIRILDLTGLTEILGTIFGPIMGIFGLPGVAATVIMAAILSTGGGIGVAAGLATNGQLNSSHAAILLVGIMLLGSLVQYMGRVVGPTGVSTKHYPVLIGVNLFVAFLGMFITQFLV